MNRRWLSLLLTLTVSCAALTLPRAATAGDDTRAGVGAAPPDTIREIDIAEAAEAAALAEAEAEPDPDKVYRGVCRAQFNLREQPEVGSTRLVNIAQGARFIMTENTNDMWCRVRIGSWEGYAQKSWLTFDEEPPRTGVSGLNNTDSGIMYICKVYRRDSYMFEEKDPRSAVVAQPKQYDYLYVMEYADDWCRVQLQSGKATGYMNTASLFHFQSTNSFRYQVPGYEQWRMTGWAILNKDVFINDHSRLYNGNDLCDTDLVMVQKGEDGVCRVMLRQELVPLDEADYEYTPFVDWREAKAGDYIYGYTQYYGKRQGSAWYKNRQNNIRLAMTALNGYVVKKGEEFKYLKAVGPVTAVNGYMEAGITGGDGPAIGGGICHVSTLTYEALLGLPFLITERDPHTTEGNSYAPREFDATVGAYSDLRFINTLPYDVKIETLLCNKSGVINMRFICNETVDPEILRNWER